MNALSLKMKALSTLATFCAKLKSPGKFIRFLESVLNAIPTPVFIKTDPSTYLYVNTAFTEFVHKSKEEVFNRPYTEVKAVELENQVLCTGESVMYMNEYTSYQGQKKVILVKLSRCTNTQGQYVLVGVLTDITEFEEQRKKLGIHEETLAALMETSSDLICILDNSLHFTYCNNRSITMLGINPKNMLDASIYDIMTPAAARSFESRVYSSVSAKKTNERIEANCMHADGSPRILDFSVSLSYSKDNFVRVYAIGRDITEKRKLFNQLMQKERILESLSVKLSRVLNSTDYEADIHDLLHGLCGTLSVSHGFIFQNYFDEPHVRCNCLYEWCEEPSLAYKDRPEFQGLAISDVPNVLSGLQKGYCFVGKKDDIPPQLRSILNSFVTSFILIPIFVQSSFWGFIGFEDNYTLKDWTSDEIHALRISATSIGASLYLRSILQKTMDDKKLYEEAIQILNHRAHCRTMLAKEQNKQLLEEINDDQQPRPDKSVSG